LYDVRCRDVARVLASGPRSRRDIGVELSKLYPGLRPRGSWVRSVLLRSNPLVVHLGEDNWGLSPLGQALVKLPGELGKPLTEEERVFLAGLLLLDERQRRVVAELLLTGRSTERDTWVVRQTARVLTELNLLGGVVRGAETQL
jgi:hypothetical protein